MIARLCNNKIIAPVIFEGNCNKAIFTTYVKNILLRELIESVGCSILFLPRYSPDLNPIEHYWFKIKNEIRKLSGEFKDIIMAVEHVLKFI